MKLTLDQLTNMLLASKLASIPAERATVTLGKFSVFVDYEDGHWSAFFKWPGVAPVNGAVGNFKTIPRLARELMNALVLDGIVTEQKKKASRRQTSRAR